MVEDGPPQAQLGAAAEAQSLQVFAGEEVENVVEDVALAGEEVDVVVVQSVRFQPADQRRVLFRLFCSVENARRFEFIRNSL